MILFLTLLIGLSYFTVKILVESGIQAVKSTHADCRDMTRTEHFFPKYKHTK